MLDTSSIPPKGVSCKSPHSLRLKVLSCGNSAITPLQRSLEQSAVFPPRPVPTGTTAKPSGGMLVLWTHRRSIHNTRPQAVEDSIVPSPRVAGMSHRLSGACLWPYVFASRFIEPSPHGGAIAFPFPPASLTVGRICTAQDQDTPVHTAASQAAAYRRDQLELDLGSSRRGNLVTSRALPVT